MIMQIPLATCVLFAAGFDWLEALLPFLFVAFWIVSQVFAVFRRLQGGGRQQPQPPRPRFDPPATGLGRHSQRPRVPEICGAISRSRSRSFSARRPARSGRSPRAISGRSISPRSRRASQCRPRGRSRRDLTAEPMPSDRVRRHRGLLLRASVSRRKPSPPRVILPPVRPRCLRSHNSRRPSRWPGMFRMLFRMN
jgi:hypothetical protein